jgi:hypothetical protein
MKYLRFVLSILMLAEVAMAAPLPIQIIVNNDTMQCARFLPGDECMDCTPPDGWEILRQYSSCPNNYALVEESGNCKGFEVEHCCTEGHSGASGDCGNMIKNDITDECAFLANAMNSTVPNGWQKMPENASPSSWVCPRDYRWTTLTSSISTALTQYGSVNVVSVIGDQDFHASSGNYVSGWTWLTQSGQSATWTFHNLPTNKKLYIYLAPLVTRPSGNSGGSGYSTDARITYGTISGSINATVALKNTHPEFLMPADTMGWGYQTFGYLMIPADKIPLDGTIMVTLTKLPNAEHIAVNKQCCSIEYI